MREQAANDAALTSAASELIRFLYRPIVFLEPERVVHPPSWLEHVPFAFWLVEAARPRVFVELGTQSGNSYGAFAQAMQVLELPTAAYAVDTWRGDDQAGFYDERVFQEWEAYHAQRFSGFSRLIRSTFDEALVHFADRTIDLLHIDGCHTYDAVSSDYARWLPKLSDRGVVLFHDTNVRERDFGAWRFWQEVRALHSSFEFLHGHGLGVLGVGRNQPPALQWLFSASSNASETHDTRAFFSRMGSAVAARFRADTAETTLRLERAHHETTVESFTSQLRTASDGIGRLEARIRYQQDQAAAFRQQGEDAVRQMQLEAERRIEEEARRREEAEAALVRVQEDARIQRDEAEQRREQVERALAGALSELTALAEIAELQTHPDHEAQRRDSRPTGQPRAGGTNSWLALLRRPRRLREARAIARSRLFDEAYYLARYPDVEASGMSPLAHFVLHGGPKGRAPHPLFDADYYLRRNRDVAAGRVNPLAHYVRRGAIERRNPSPLFDVAYYLDSNPDVAAAGAEPLRHFLAFGAAEGRNPNPFFDCAYYLAQMRPRDEGINPLVHFATTGWRTGARPSAAFDPAFYRATYEDVRRSGENPLAHFLEYGRADGRSPVGTMPAARAPQVSRPMPVKLKVRTPGSRPAQRIVLCATPFLPLPGRGGNDRRVYRLLKWLRLRGYRIVPVIAPLPGEELDARVVAQVADEFGNAVVCRRDGRVDYLLADIPDVLASLDQEFTRTESSAAGAERPVAIAESERAICHDPLVATIRRLHFSLRPYVFLAESLWMTRLLPGLTGQVFKVADLLPTGPLDTGVPTPALWPGLASADLLLTLREAETEELQSTVPGRRTLGVAMDCEGTELPASDGSRRIVCDIPDSAENRLALSDFLMFAWPRVRRNVPDAELVIGENVAAIVENNPLPGVHAAPAGSTASDLYADAAAAISPAAAETGCRPEIVDAVAHMRPVVTWSTVRCPVEIEDADNLYHPVNDWFEFARRLVQLLQAPGAERISEQERQNIRRATSADHVYAALGTALDTFFGNAGVPASHASAV
jgi:hypothetical protein